VPACDMGHSCTWIARVSGWHAGHLDTAIIHILFQVDRIRAQSFISPPCVYSVLKSHKRICYFYFFCHKYHTCRISTEFSTDKIFLGESIFFIYLFINYTNNSLLIYNYCLFIRYNYTCKKIFYNLNLQLVLEFKFY
jgi:hypothetical protein